MKKIFTMQFTILCVVLTIVSCAKEKAAKRGGIDKTLNLSGAAITLRMDTFEVSDKGQLSDVVVYHDKYYIMFTTYLKNSPGSMKNMVVVGQSGLFVENVSLPDDFKTLDYYDICVENDSLFVKDTQHEEKAYFVDEKGAEFKAVSKQKLKSYQDGDYNVYTVNHGEWGGTTYFQGRANDSVYKIQYFPSSINRMDSAYYLTYSRFLPWGHSSVLKISNPQLLKKSPLDFAAPPVDEKIGGGEEIFYSQEICIVCSFVLKNRLLHIYSNNKSTYIGEIVDGDMQPVYKFEFNFTAFQSMHNENGKQVYGCFIRDRKSEKGKKAGFKLFNDNSAPSFTDNKGAILTIDNDSIIFHELN